MRMYVRMTVASAHCPQLIKVYEPIDLPITDPDELEELIYSYAHTFFYAARPVIDNSIPDEDILKSIEWTLEKI